jgi:hypothetical protein
MTTKQTENGERDETRDQVRARCADAAQRAIETAERIADALEPDGEQQPHESLTT